VLFLFERGGEKGLGRLKRRGAVLEKRKGLPSTHREGLDQAELFKERGGLRVLLDLRES